MYTKGCDPEVFLFDAAAKKYISSIGLIGGSKESPMPIEHGCAVQEDNVTVEFNIPPAKTADEFVGSINFALQHIDQRAKELGLSVAIDASAEFSPDQLDNPMAQEFGCEPDFNAWKDGDQNPRPRSENRALRSCGGHIHVELDVNKVDILHVVKCMDLFIGTQMLKHDPDTKRRSLYGKPGAFRVKPYGIEYRTVSNAWLRSEELIRWVWDQTDRAVDFALNGGYTFTDDDATMIQECILNSDMNLLQQIEAKFPMIKG